MRSKTSHISMCYFCKHGFKNQSDHDDIQVQQQNKLFQNLFLQLQLDSSQLPEQCSVDAIPRCGNCQELLKHALNAWLAMVNAVERIQKTVVDSENKPVHEQPEGFVQLRRLIISGKIRPLVPPSPTSNDADERNNAGCVAPSSSASASASVSNLASMIVCPNAATPPSNSSVPVNMAVEEEQAGAAAVPPASNEESTRKRRILCMGVEVNNRCISNDGLYALHCSLCTYKIEHPDGKICKRKTRDVMKEHFLSSHTDVECDVCGFRIELNSGKIDSLLVHKFSHKSKEEKEAALAAGEPGALRAGRWYCKRTSASTKSRGRTHFGTSRKKNKKGTAAANQKDSPSFKSIGCKDCNKKFISQRLLILHMRTHWVNVGSTLS